MTRRVFYSFHYKPDSWRVSQVRNIGAVEDNEPVSDNEWETVKKGGDKEIQKWIDGQLRNRGCTIVLIGEKTAERQWIKYEIKKSWVDKKGVLGIYIHNIKNLKSEKCTKGSNPFSDFTLCEGKRKMSSIVECYDPPYTASKSAYEYIAENIENWVEEAIAIRNDFKC